MTYKRRRMLINARQYSDMAVSLCHLVEQTKTVTMCSHCVLAGEVLRGELSTTALVTFRRKIADFDFLERSWRSLEIQKRIFSRGEQRTPATRKAASRVIMSGATTKELG